MSGLALELRESKNTEWSKPIDAVMTSGGLVNFAIDREEVLERSRLIHDPGALAGGSSPAVVNDKIIRDLKLTIDTQPIIDLQFSRNNVLYAGEILRILNSIENTHQSSPHEAWDLRFHPFGPPHPKSGNIELDIQVNPLTTFTTGTPTGYTGAFFYLENRGMSKPAWAQLNQSFQPEYLLQVIERTRTSFGTDTGSQILKLPTGEVYDPRGFIILVNDVGGAGAADNLFDACKLEVGKKVLFDTHEKFLKVREDVKTRQTVGAGIYHIPFTGVLNTIGADTLNFTFEIPSAATDLQMTTLTYTRIFPKGN